MVGFFTATQDHRVAGFQAQAGNVDGDVWPRLINHANHPERYPATFQLQPAVQQAAVQYVADRVVQAAYLTHIVGDRRQTCRGQQQAIEQRFAHSAGACLLHVLFVSL
ncbi:hypothetical protein D3C71_1828110 [compost metagenome]